MAGNRLGSRCTFYEGHADTLPTVKFNAASERNSSCVQPRYTSWPSHGSAAIKVSSSPFRTAINDVARGMKLRGIGSRAIKSHNGRRKTLQTKRVVSKKDSNECTRMSRAEWRWIRIALIVAKFVTPKYPISRRIQPPACEKVFFMPCLLLFSD